MNESTKIDVLVAAHKNYKMPSSKIYKPIFVGSALHPDNVPATFQRDDSGENISKLNPIFNELTAIYWAWKNDTADVVGLVHYRHYFMTKSHGKRNFDDILTSSEILKCLETKQAILPVKRNYYIETTYSQYEHAHNISDLETTRSIILEMFPEYATTFDYVMKQKKSHRFNMFIMKKNVFDAYCEWLFPILFELGKRVNMEGYSQYQQRVIGFVSERLFDVWIEFNSIDYCEKPVRFMEKQNWLKKGSSFVGRKLFAKESNLDNKLKR